MAKKSRNTWISTLPGRSKTQLKSNRFDATDLSLRLYRHVLHHWGDTCQDLSIEAKGRFFYIGATERVVLPEEKSNKRKARRADPEPTHFKLCRVEYLGYDDAWNFAFYKYSDEKYEVAIFPSGSFEGTPEEAFDCAAGVYLVGF